jgi:GTPase SAR1 family protein
VDKKIVFLGTDGSGKTTAVRMYARSEKSKIIWELNAKESETLIHS